jgi:hypothetical protein
VGPTRHTSIPPRRPTRTCAIAHAVIVRGNARFLPPTGSATTGSYTVSFFDAILALMSGFVEDIRRAVARGDLPHRFRPDDVRRACLAGRITRTACSCQSTGAGIRAGTPSISCRIRTALTASSADLREQMSWPIGDFGTAIQPSVAAAAKSSSPGNCVWSWFVPRARGLAELTAPRCHRCAGRGERRLHVFR